jgi:hypothetical protein
MQTVSALAQAAFIYGYPMVDIYSILYKYVADPASPEYKAPLNQLYNTRRVATAEDRAIVAPELRHALLLRLARPARRAGGDLDPLLRAGTLRLADVERPVHLHHRLRHAAHQRPRRRRLPDRRASEWAGSTPRESQGVFHCADAACAGLLSARNCSGRTTCQNVWQLQDHIQVQTAVAYLGRWRPTPAPALAWIEPLDVRKAPTSPHFFAVLNWMLQYMPALADEQALRARLATIGVAPAAGVPRPGRRNARRPGARDAGRFAGDGRRAGPGQVFGELFGSRDFLGHKYLSRAVGAMVGILGNSAEEYLGIGYPSDADGQPFDGSHAYCITFTPATMPPVRAFWSITVYDAAMLLYANPLDRYVINSPMVKDLVKDEDGGFTLYVQHASPGADKEANWLPVPAGKFNLTFRAYQPEQAILDFSYHAPPVVKVK